jgi:hypothetical protein
LAVWRSLEASHGRTSDYPHSSWSLDNFLIVSGVFASLLSGLWTGSGTTIIRTVLRWEPSIRTRQSALPG